MFPLRIRETTLTQLKRIYSIWLGIQVFVILYHLYFIVHRIYELPHINKSQKWCGYYTHTLYLLAAVFIGVVFELSSMLTGIGSMLVFDKRSVSGHSVFAVCCLTVNFLPTFLCDLWYHRIDFLIPFNLIFILYVCSVILLFSIKLGLNQPDHTRFYAALVV